MKWMIALVPPLLLLGCSFGSESPVPDGVYLLEPMVCAEELELGKGAEGLPDRELRIATTEVPSYIQTGKFVFGTANRERRFYQFARWAVSPGAMLNRAIEDRLRCSRLFRAVHRRGVLAKASHSLDITVLDFFHDARTEPGFAVIDLDIALIESETEQLLGQSRFQARAPLATFDAPGAAAAFEAARNQIVEEIAAWVQAQLDRSATLAAEESPPAADLPTDGAKL